MTHVGAVVEQHLSPSHSSRSVFSTLDFTCCFFFFFSPRDWIFRDIAEPPEWQINPPQTDFFFFFFLYLDHHLHHTWNYSAGPVWEMGSKSTEKHEITEMYFFPFPLSLCICKLPLCLLHFMRARRFTQRYGSLVALFYFFPFPFRPPPRSLCPSKFPGDFITPISNRIETQFAMPHVTLLPNSTLDIDTS